MNHDYTFQKTDFGKFVAQLQAFGTVFAPVRVSNASFAFKSIVDASDIALDALRTILPPKKFFYPQHETLLRFEGSRITDAVPDVPPFVIFGVHPCDLAGLRVLDTIFTAAPSDNHYVARRQKCIIVGMGCMPDKYCFCQSVGSDKVESGYDLFLTDIGEHYFLQLMTPAALRIFESCDVLVPVTRQDINDFQDFWNRRANSFESSFDSTNLRSNFNLTIDDPLWEELGNRCLSCGNCTPVCPTCYCFDVTDVASLDGNSGERQREWDSCQFSGFAAVAGGHNFRPGPVDRLKFWFRHKLHGFEDPYGFPTCVGCGRCTVSCPAGIDDIVGVVLHIQGNQVKLAVPGVNAGNGGNT